MQTDRTNMLAKKLNWIKTILSLKTKQNRNHMYFAKLPPTFSSHSWLKFFLHFFAKKLHISSSRFVVLLIINGVLESMYREEAPKTSRGKRRDNESMS